MPSDTLAFFCGFLRRPAQVASVVPSSAALVERVVNRVEAARARVIVELGPGTGVVTRGLLAAMPPESRLVAVELMPAFADRLGRDVPDHRLHIFRGAARQLEEALAEVGQTRADVVVSGIPFTTMPRTEAALTLQAVRSALGGGGRFVAYQVRDRVRRLSEPGFGPASVDRVLLNVPPMRVYTWSLPAAVGAMI